MQDYRQLLRSTSRTFAVGIEALPRELREGVTLAYLVLRVSDYFEDSPTLSPETKEECLKEWGRLLELADRPIPAGACADLMTRVSEEDRDLPDALAAIEAEGILGGVARLPAHLRDPIRRHTTDTTFGMARWIGKGDDFPDEAALDDYMFEVAGRVGLLLTDLFTAHSRRIRMGAAPLYETAVSFGLGLQTVNVIRGLHEDPDRGWTFVPRDVLRAMGTQRSGRGGGSAGVMGGAIAKGATTGLEGSQAGAGEARVGSSAGVMGGAIAKGATTGPAGSQAGAGDAMGGAVGGSAATGAPGPGDPLLHVSNDVRRLDPRAHSTILDFLVRKSGRHLEDALRYCEALPRTERGIRIFCIIPALLALRTAEISAGDPEGVFQGPIKVSRSEVGRVVLRSRLGFFSNRWLERERGRAIALTTGAVGSMGSRG